jgi:hypothetical protein
VCVCVSLSLYIYIYIYIGACVLVPFSLSFLFNLFRLLSKKRKKQLIGFIKLITHDYAIFMNSPNYSFKKKTSYTVHNSVRTQ